MKKRAKVYDLFYATLALRMVCGSGNLTALQYSLCRHLSAFLSSSVACTRDHKALDGEGSGLHCYTA